MIGLAFGIHATPPAPSASSASPNGSGTRFMEVIEPDMKGASGLNSPKKSVNVFISKAFIGRSVGNGVAALNAEAVVSTRVTRAASSRNPPTSPPTRPFVA